MAGITVVALHYFNSDLLKTFFDLHVDKAEDDREMTEVYVNLRFMNSTLSPPQPSKLTPDDI